ncbi:cilia- and flagella-associated protein 418-like [Oncorhynchus keta]|uniref:cilia- and flagella-associated protein 418-like n=1 Tax=Oncorhynchus keta TaxID=8018 RepID=UPI0015FA7F23|nr:cilia- and flagella-associated protein 418-like [Oncorhynchus keta]
MLDDDFDSLELNTGQLPKTAKTKSLPQATRKSNMRDCQKLLAKLRRRKGARVYACQCSWHSARDLTDLREQHQLKWVCGKHDV